VHCWPRCAAKANFPFFSTKKEPTHVGSFFSNMYNLSEAGLRAGDPQSDGAGGEGDEQNPAVFFIGIFSFCVWENALLPPPETQFVCRTSDGFVNCVKNVSNFSRKCLPAERICAKKFT
jgi:hypothetical protein